MHLTVSKYQACYNVRVTMYFNIVLSIFKFYMKSTCRHSFLYQHVDQRKKH